MGRAARHDARTSDTGEPLPRELFDKMLAAKNFQSGPGDAAPDRVRACSTCACTATSTRRATAARSQLLDEVRERVAVLQPPAYNRFPNNFSHIFAGGYAAGYYSYKWAEVLSADAYSLFEENGVLDAEAGRALP